MKESSRETLFYVATIMLPALIFFAVLFALLGIIFSEAAFDFTFWVKEYIQIIDGSANKLAKVSFFVWQLLCFSILFGIYLLYRLIRIINKRVS